MKAFLKVVLVLAVLGVFGYTLYFLYSKSQEKDEIYGTVQPFYETVIKKTVATGSVVPRKEIEIKPRVSGIIDELYVEPGDMVNTGDLIAKVKIIPDMVTLNNAESRVKQAKLRFKNLELEYNRNLKLYDEGVIAKTEYEQVDLQFDQAEEEYKSAVDNLELIKKGVTKNSGQATNTLIRAAIKGMVLDVPVEVGNSVIESNTFNDGTTIASIADMGEMIFEGNVDESEVGKIGSGMDLILTIGAIENKKFDAKLEYISPKGVEENGAIQFEIRAAMQLKEGFFIRAGYSANADIVLDRRDSVLCITESLLKFEKDSTFVEIETAPQVFEKRTVKTGLSDGINIEILEGVAENDKIKNWNDITRK